MAIAAVSLIGVPREQAPAEIPRTGVDIFADLLRQSRKVLSAEPRPQQPVDIPVRNSQPVEPRRGNDDRAAVPQADDSPRTRASEQLGTRESEARDASTARVPREAGPSTEENIAEASEAEVTETERQASESEVTEVDLGRPSSDGVPPGQSQLLATSPLVAAVTTPIAARGGSAVPGDATGLTPGVEGDQVEAAPGGPLDQAKAPSAPDQDGAADALLGRFSMGGGATGLAGAGARPSAAPATLPSTGPLGQAEALARSMGPGSAVTVEVVRDAPGGPPVQPAGGLVVALSETTGDATGGDGALQGDGTPPQDPAAIMSDSGSADATPTDPADAFQSQLDVAEAVVAVVDEGTPLPSKPGSVQATPVGGVGQVAQAGQLDGPRQAAATSAPPPRPAAPPPPSEQIRVGIERALGEGKDSITMQLRPERLGHIEVKLEVAADGRLSATIAADNRDTLQMLQRDARDLQRALESAGFSADQRDLNFNLRQGREQGGQHADRGTRVRRGDAVAEIGAPLPSAVRPATSRAGGLDIRV